MRLFHALRSHVAEFLDIRPASELPADARAYADQVVGHMIDALSWDHADLDLTRGSRRNWRGVRRRRRVGRQRLDPRAVWLELQEVPNGRWWILDGVPVHYHIDEKCCNYHDRATCITRVTTALFRTILARRPPPPCTIKWTKLGPCTDWVFIGCAIHGLLPRIYKRAFGKLSATMTSSSMLKVSVEWPLMTCMWATGVSDDEFREWTGVLEKARSLLGI